MEEEEVMAGVRGYVMGASGGSQLCSPRRWREEDVRVAAFLEAAPGYRYRVVGLEWARHQGPPLGRLGIR